MQRKVIRNAIAVVALACAAAACSDIAGPLELLEVTVFVTPGEIVPGDTTLIHVVARNPLSRTLTFEAGDCLLGAEIVAGNGEVVPLLRDRWCTGGWTQHLGAGEKLSQTLEFAGLTLHTAGTSHEWRPLAPGSYLVYGLVAAGSRSAPAQLQILPVNP